VTRTHTPESFNGILVKALEHREWGQPGPGIGMAIGFGGIKLCGTGESAEEAAIALVEQVLVSVEKRMQDAAEHGEIPPQVLSRVRRLNAGFMAKLRTLHSEVKGEMLEGVYDELTQHLRSDVDPLSKYMNMDDLL